MKRLAALSMVSLMLTGPASAGALDRKGLADVKTVALVSFYAPKRVQAAVHTFGKGWAYMDPVKDHRQGEALSGKEQTDADAQALYDQALAAFQNRLAEAGWSYVPFSTVAANPAYRAVDPKTVAVAPAPEGNTAHFEKSGGLLRKLGRLQAPEKRQVNRNDPFNTMREQTAMPSADDNRVAAGMLFVPVESITDGQFRLGNDPFKAEKETLARLARALNVDAVAVVDATLAYHYDKPVTRKTRDHMTALPRVAARLILVNKDGRVAGDTGAIGADKAPAADGPPVELVRDSHLRLEDAAVRQSYTAAIDGAAAQLKTVLAADLAARP